MLPNATSRTALRVAALAALLLTPQAAQAAREVEPSHPFPMVGVTFGQTLRVNVVNVGGVEPDGGDSQACEVLFGVVDAMSRVLVSTRAMLAPGQSAFVDLRVDNPDFRGQRFQVRPTVTFTNAPRARQSQCGAVVPSGEVFDTGTGAGSLFVHPGVIKGFNPQPDPPGAPAPRTR